MTSTTYEVQINSECDGVLWVMNLFIHVLCQLVNMKLNITTVDLRLAKPFFLSGKIFDLGMSYTDSQS